MGQQQIAGFAVLVAMAFLIMALSACASSVQAPFAPIVATDPVDAPAEFHDAHISNDALRDRLVSE